MGQVTFLALCSPQYSTGAGVGGAVGPLVDGGTVVVVVVLVVVVDSVLVGVVLPSVVFVVVDSVVVFVVDTVVVEAVVVVVGRGGRVGYGVSAEVATKYKLGIIFLNQNYFPILHTLHHTHMIRTIYHNYDFFYKATIFMYTLF